MDQELINNDLRDGISTKMQDALLKYLKSLLKASSDKMCDFHDRWDDNSHIYRGYRVGDRKDADAKSKDEPPKIIVPITYAQTQTALSFLMSTFMTNDTLFPIVGRGPEDVSPAKGMNEDLMYQSNKTDMYLKLYFWLLDATKQGFGVVRNEWITEKQRMRVQEPVPAGGLGNVISGMFGGEQTMQMQEAVQEVVTYEGNKVTNISPYAFYPDPSVTIANFQDGQFVATEDEKSRESLKTLEGTMYHGVNHIPTQNDRDLTTFRKRRVRGPFDNKDNAPVDISHKDLGKPVVVSEVEFIMSEKDASAKFFMDLGKDETPVKWLATLCNDSKIVRFEPVANLHGRFGFEVIEFSPDNDAFYNPGLADTIYELQNIITFLLNSHIVNVRKTIANRFLVKEEDVNLNDIKNGSIYIRVKGVQSDLGKVVKQLDVSDITKSHIQDIQSLMQLMQVVTGINENATGQYATGRRSATESKNVNAGAAARLKMTSTLMWLQGIKSLGKQQLANTRQWRSKEMYEQIVGALAKDAPYETTILADPTKIAGGYDFIPHDATLPTDKQHQAAVLTELFSLLVSNPESMQILNKNPMEMMHHIAQLHGIKNLEEFNLQDIQAQPQVQVVPDSEIPQVIADGGEPVDMPGGEALLRGLQNA